jgi:hypothetical protein
MDAQRSGHAVRGMRTPFAEAGSNDITAERHVNPREFTQTRELTWRLEDGLLEVAHTQLLR